MRERTLDMELHIENNVLLGFKRDGYICCMLVNNEEIGETMFE